MWRKKIPLKRISHIIKKSLVLLWIFMLLSAGYFYISNPEWFTVYSLKNFLEQFWGWLLVVYFVISALRGFTLIPSLPFVMVWALLFPGSPYFVFAISLIGILLSSSMVYFFSREMGFEEILQKKYPHALKKYEKWIASYGFVTVSIWSFIIVLPTDLICYIAGVLQMKFWKFITAVAIGEAVICGFVIFGGSSLFRFL